MARRNLQDLMKASAKNWAQRYTILARSKAPKHIAPYITTSSTVSEGQITIKSTIKPIDMRGSEGQISNYGTLDATAQEYGHPGATITPRVKSVLAFHWNIRPEYAKYDAEGRIRLQIVNKKPQPAFNSDQGYMRPAMREWSDEIMQSSARFKDAIKLDILDSFNAITKATR